MPRPTPAPSGRVPLWLVLEDALAGTTVVADWTRAQQPPAPLPVPAPRRPSDVVVVPAAHGGRITDLALVVLTVVVLLVAATVVAVLAALT